MMDAGRELDALTEEKIIGHAVSLRWCSRDPDCGGWDECESVRDETADYTDATWYSQQPCYQPYAHNDAAWRVVAHYSTDIGAAWLVWQKARELRGTKAAIFWSVLRNLVALRTGWDYRISDLTTALFMEPDDICKAMLEMHGERMMPAWFYEDPTP